MSSRAAFAVVAVVLAASVSGIAQTPARYRVPRTEFGQPDLQGVWITQFLTPLERMPNATTLTVTPPEARVLADAFLKNGPVLTDPDTNILGLNELAKVNGEYRTSVIVDPEDGKMPLTPAGADLVAKVQARNRKRVDDPEDRPLPERCLENLTYAPIRTVPVLLPRLIVQTKDDVVISAEDVPGPRIISLHGTPPPASFRTVGGYSAGHWEGDTLVVETTHLRADDPSRMAAGRPLVISRDTAITERFTRVSATELVYRFTVRDAALYTRPWTGEFSLTRTDDQVLEYACHEANYSLTNMLRGGRVEDQAAGSR